MRYLRFFLMMAIFKSLSACNLTDSNVHIDVYSSFQSRWVSPRQIEVLLPPGYDPSKAYDVIYMHDGQNVFNPHTSYSGVAWAVEKALKKLYHIDEVRPAIVVAVWNSPKRMQEYMPEIPEEKIKDQLEEHPWAAEIISGHYLKFLVEELKPFIDSTYSTIGGPENTFIMGSSMGGLISLYALTEYPHIFGAAACLSTHWPALDGVVLEYLPDHLPAPGKHRIYFDFGTKTLDKVYETYQRKVDSIMQTRGYTHGVDWVTMKFDGANHSEKAWSKRVDIPLKFLLGKQ